MELSSWMLERCQIVQSSFFSETQIFRIESECVVQVMISSCKWKICSMTGHGLVRGGDSW